jgi:hypothetical protein
MSSEGERHGQKIMSAQDLKGIKESVDQEKKLRQSGNTARITVHMGTAELLPAQKGVDAGDELSKCGRSDVVVTSSGCIDCAARNP